MIRYENAEYIKGTPGDGVYCTIEGFKEGQGSYGGCTFAECACSKCGDRFTLEIGQSDVYVCECGYRWWMSNVSVTRAMEEVPDPLTVATTERDALLSALNSALAARGLPLIGEPYAGELVTVGLAGEWLAEALTGYAVYSKQDNNRMLGVVVAASKPEVIALSDRRWGEDVATGWRGFITVLPIAQKRARAAERAEYDRRHKP